ncbi:MAG: hypothetical protein HQK96_06100 [Nitrospirae bacterium]|nr:hypothetical protein [Nitrospirota bacterium]
MTNLERAINRIWSQYSAFFKNKAVSVVANNQADIGIIRFNLKKRNSVNYSDDEILCAWKSFIKKQLK